MLKRAAVLALLFATAALAADEAETIKQELADAQSWGSLLETAFAVSGGVIATLVGARRLWRRLQRKRQARRAMIVRAMREAEDAEINRLISAALERFKVDIMQPDFEATLNAVRAILYEHSETASSQIAEHARETASQIKTVSVAVGSMAATVEQTCGRLERRVESCHDRIDDFLRAVVAGQVPYFRAQPRDQRLLEGPAAPEREQPI